MCIRDSNSEAIRGDLKGPVECGLGSTHCYAAIVTKQQVIVSPLRIVASKLRANLDFQETFMASENALQRCQECLQLGFRKRQVSTDLIAVKQW